DARQQRSLARSQQVKGWAHELALAGVSTVLGCSAPGETSLGSSRSEIVYGADDRLDLYEVDDRALRELALQSSLAALDPEDLTRKADGSSVISAPTLAELTNLCPSEPFGEEPSAASCSGVLVDDQLVLTAGHCFDERATCDERRWVFNY